MNTNNEWDTLELVSEFYDELILFFLCILFINAIFVNGLDNFITEYYKLAHKAAFLYEHFTINNIPLTLVVLEKRLRK